MAYKINATVIYDSDVDDTMDYIANVLYSPAAARNLRVKIRRTVMLIEDNPYIFPIYHDEEIAKLGYRFAVVSDYLLFYRVDEKNKVIYLLHFLNGRQNIQMYIK